ncbi:hypothetical protein [Streptomyces sp. V3I7]|uniref:hypothetical protein n=1 Tax=Streptomyces sp. V3I7 TaxID=3042278 RepID=UPI002782D1C0|nr:hypothetical protein [Streptomyces sp. V3I7]MDQ0993627.1 hypothetical protein [Streptomyces sp. V3I7]
MRTRSGRGAARGRVVGAADHAVVPYAAQRTLGGRWLILGRDGRLTAYARTDGGLLRWTELRRGGPEWSGPDFFPVADLTDVTVVQGADSYVHFLGRREVRGAESPAAVDIVHAVQYQTGRPVTEWRSLGNPHRDRAEASRLGVPIAAVSGSGRVYVFVRGADGGVIVRREGPTGKWEPWHVLKGSRARDGLVAVAHPSGRVELLAGGETIAMRWRQDETDGAFRQDPNIPVRVAPGTVSALATGPERTTYYWAAPDGGGFVAHRPGEWAHPLGGAPAGEPLSAVRATLDAYDCTVLAHRDLEGQVVLAAYGTENEQGGLWWAPTGERLLGSPALALDGFGRVVLAVLDPDGTLRIARQADAPGLELAPSLRV